MIEDQLLDDSPRKIHCLSSVYAARLLLKRANRNASNKKARGSRKRRSARTETRECMTNTRARKVQDVSTKRRARQHKLQQILQDEYVLYNDRCIPGFFKNSVLEVPASIDPSMDDDMYNSFNYVLEDFQISTHKVERSVACEKDNDLASAYEDNQADREWMRCSDRDLRATSRGQLRDRKQKEKYYRYRASKPSTIGKSCYTLTMTKPERGSDGVITSTKRCAKPKYPSVSREYEDCAALKKVAKKTLYLVGLNTSDIVVMAASSADRVRRRSRTPVPVDGALLPSNALDLALEEFHRRASEMRVWNMAWYVLSRENLDARLRLKVRKWTKRDNYENRTNFHNSYYIAHRHHSRKLGCEGKRYKKMTLRQLGRDTKSNSRAIGAYRISSDRWCANDNEVRFECCLACECFETVGRGFNTEGVEEYLWEWDEAERWTWQDEYWWRTEIQLGSLVEDDIDAVHPAGVLDGTGYEDQFSIGQPQVIQENVDESDAAPPGTPMSDWELHSMSDPGSDFDLISELAGAISDSDWEELAFNDA